MAGPWTPSTRITNILASTLEKWKKDIAEHIINEIPMLKYMDSKGSKMVLDGGEFFSYPLLHGGQAAQFYLPGTATMPVVYGAGGGAAAFEPTTLVQLSQVAIASAGRNDWSYLLNQVAITADEKLRNMGDSAVMSLIKGKIRAAELHIQYALNTSIFKQQSYPANRNVVSLQVVAPGRAADCVKAGETYHCSGIAYGDTRFNVSKWHHQLATGQADYSDLLVPFLAMWVALKKEGAFKTDVIAIHSAPYVAYEALAQNNIKFMPNDKLDFGFAAASYKGIPMIIDDNCVNGAADPGGAPGATMNEFTDECAYFLNLDSLGFFVHKDRNIEIGPMIKSQGHVDLEYSEMKWMGGTWCNNRRAQGCVLFNL